MKTVLALLAALSLAACISFNRTSGDSVPCQGHGPQEVWNIGLAGSNLGCRYLEQRDVLKRYQQEDGSPEAAAVQIVGLALRDKADGEAIVFSNGTETKALNNFKEAAVLWGQSRVEKTAP